MRSLLLLVLAVTTAALPLFDAFQSPLFNAFQTFKKEHEKVYESLEEEERKFAVFVENVIELEERNKIEKIHGITRVSTINARLMLNK